MFCKIFRRCSSRFFIRCNRRNGHPSSVAGTGAFDPIMRHDARARPGSKKIRWAKCPSRQSALYGASTQRAVLNFPISGYRFSRPFIRALGLVKWAAAQANPDLGLLDAERGRADRPGRRRSGGRQTRRTFSARHFSDRFGHEHQYERERGDCESLLPTCGQTDRLARAGASERSRQHGSVEQRRDSLGHTHQRGGTAQELVSSRLWKTCTPRSTRKRRNSGRSSRSAGPI